jgi:hypothetical protein
LNHYILIRRLTGPAVLLLLGIVALLSEAHVAGWGIFIPLLLILLGVLKLAERVALTGEEYPQGGPYGGGQYGGGSYPGGPYSGGPGAGGPGGPTPYSGQSSTSIVPAPPHDLSKGPDGGSL